MIRLENVCKVYKGSDVPVVNDLNLHIKKGEICVLVGASGCGKTTTMRMINRLIDITKGQIFVDDKDIMTIDRIELRRNIGYVIQDTGLFPHYSIEKNIATVPIEKKWEKQRIATRVAEMMELVDLDPVQYAKKKPSALSGGQKQRVGVARALAGDPPIMLMDEPFGALDPITRARLQNEFLHIQAKLKKTIVFVTHDMDEAVKMGNKIAVMQYGKCAQFGTPHEILTRPANEFVESLVGQNRILKKFSLMPCNGFQATAPFFPIQARDEIVQAVKQAPSSLQNIGITDAAGHPLGFVPIAAGLHDGETLESRIVPYAATVTEGQTLYDALSLMFSSGDRSIFCVDGENKVKSLIGISELYEAVNEDGKIDDCQIG